MPGVVYTIGHSNHPIERFLDLLRLHGIDAVADVRSQPFSRYNPQFNRETLRDSLKQFDIAYVYLGQELGARADDPDCYIDGQVQFDRLARTPLFRAGLSRLERGAARHRIALMCAEKDPLTCHRTILVCPHVEALGFEVRHILDDGRIETHAEALDRLLADSGWTGAELFRGPDEALADAWKERERQIAYRLPTDDSAEESAGDLEEENR